MVTQTGSDRYKPMDSARIEILERRVTKVRSDNDVFMDRCARVSEAVVTVMALQMRCGRGWSERWATMLNDISAAIGC
jgi:hypothetical protein